MRADVLRCTLLGQHFLSAELAQPIGGYSLTCASRHTRSRYQLFVDKPDELSESAVDRDGLLPAYDGWLQAWLRQPFFPTAEARPAGLVVLADLRLSNPGGRDHDRSICVRAPSGGGHVRSLCEIAAHRTAATENTDAPPARTGSGAATRGHVIGQTIASACVPWGPLNRTMAPDPAGMAAGHRAIIIIAAR